MPGESNFFASDMSAVGEMRNIFLQGWQRVTPGENLLRAAKVSRVSVSIEGRTMVE